MTILVEIQCDRQDDRARGKDACYSRSNRNPTGTGRTHVEAHNFAKPQATGAGWIRRLIRHKGERMAWLCPNCAALADADAKS